MCGIVGYVGESQATEFLIQGLHRLEYRGYDSSGVATITDTGELAITKAAGRIDRLEAQLAIRPAPGPIGIGHTRWATHGAATDSNAHPHVGGNQVVALVHNGVIENFMPLKQRLQAEGFVFHSATDSEVIAHLIVSCLEQQGYRTTGAEHSADEIRESGYAIFISALKAALAQLHGTYGLAVLFRDCPEAIFAARLGSPLVVGVGQAEHFVASDASPLAGFTDKIVYLSDHQLAVVTADSLRILHRDQGQISPNVQTLNYEAGDVDLGDYAHYMLKEIFEQPESLANTMRGRLNRDEATAIFGGLNVTPQQLRTVDRMVMTACGTSWHAALVGEYLIEEFARIAVEVEYASELRYRNPPLEKNTLLFAITQSGETADTLAALRE